MSVAIANTQSRIGIRTLGTYRASDVYRGPAEPGPRSAGSIAKRLSGLMVADGDGGAPVPVSNIIRIKQPILQTVVPSPLNPDGTASQAPTGSVVSSASQMNPQAVATPVTPAPIPTSVAQLAPANAPGYVVISSGGGTVANPSPDYVGEVKDWLTEQSLISGIPNWVIAGGVAAVLLYISRSGARR